MTLQQVLDEIDEKKANTMSLARKLKYISDVEGKVHAEILMKHEHDAEDETCPVYDEDTNADETEMLVPDIYADLYIYYVLIKIDEDHQEEDKESNNRVRFKNAWDDFACYWTREHMPLQPARYYIL